MKELPKIKIPTLREFVAASERKSYLLIPLESVEKESEKITIKIPENPPVVYNKEGRRILELENDSWRWAAGGIVVVIILPDGHIGLVTPHRDPGAPTYAGHDTASSGLSCSFEEMLQPLRIALREGFEETIIKFQGKILYPEFDEVDKKNIPELDFKCIAKDGASWRNETRNCPLAGVNASILHLPGEKEICVEWNGKIVSSIRGLINFDPNVNGIDILTVVTVKINAVDWNEINILDGEIAGGNLIKRKFHLWKLDENFKPTGEIIGEWDSSGRFFVPKEGTNFPQTPVLREIFKALNAL